MSCERKISLNPLLSLIREYKAMVYFTCMPSFPTLCNKVGEELDDTCLTVVCSLTVSLNFGGIKKIYHLVGGKGSQRREMGIAVVFSSEETSIYSSR